MEMLKDFEDYLRYLGKSEKTIANYIGAFSFISKINSKNSIPEVHKWNSYTIDEYIKTIAEDDEFISKNTKGNNMYSASLNNFKKTYEKNQ